MWNTGNWPACLFGVTEYAKYTNKWFLFCFYRLFSDRLLSIRHICGPNWKVSLCVFIGLQLSDFKVNLKVTAALAYCYCYSNTMPGTWPTHDKNVWCGSCGNVKMFFYIEVNVIYIKWIISISIKVLCNGNIIILCIYRHSLP